MEDKHNKPRKDFHKKGKFGGKKFGEKKFGGRGKSFGKDKPDFKKRKLAPGVEFVDRELGVGIVRKLTDEGIVAAFGDAEKLIPRKKREGGFKKDGFKKDGHRKDFKKDFKKETFSATKPMEKKVFTFDAPLPDAKPTGFKKREAAVGLEVTDETLGKGTITRITERGTYVTYDATGERILYPMGLPSKLLKTAFPEVKKETKKEAPKGKARTYTVPEAERPAPKPKVEVRPVKETHRGNTHYIELGVGTPVISSVYGQGVITDIADGKLIVDFGNTEQSFSYPKAFAEGQIEVVED